MRYIHLLDFVVLVFVVVRCSGRGGAYRTYKGKGGDMQNTCIGTGVRRGLIIPYQLLRCGHILIQICIKFHSWKLRRDESRLVGLGVLQEPIHVIFSIPLVRIFTTVLELYHIVI